MVTVNSDDPSYFGAYVGENFAACHAAFGLTAGELAELARNSFAAAFIPETEKQRYLALLDDYLRHSKS